MEVPSRLKLKKVPSEDILRKCMVLTSLITIVLVISAGISCYRFMKHDKEDLDVFD